MCPGLILKPIFSSNLFRHFDVIPMAPTATDIWASSPGARFSKVPKTFRTRKAVHKTLPHLFCEAGLVICCKGNKNLNNCKVSCLEMPLFWRYKENYVTRNALEKFRDFRETGSWYVSIVSLVSWPLNESEAGIDLGLINLAAFVM